MSVPRVCARRGNTSSRTPLIIVVFGEFGASVFEKKELFAGLPTKAFLPKQAYM